MAENNNEYSPIQRITPSHEDILANLASIEETLQSEELAIAIEKAEQTALCEDAIVELKRAREVVAGLSIEVKTRLLVPELQLELLSEKTEFDNKTLKKSYKRTLILSVIIGVTSRVFSSVIAKPELSIPIAVGASVTNSVFNEKKRKLRVDKFYLDQLNSQAANKILEQARSPKTQDQLTSSEE
jgi:hypothetical protein